MPLVGLAHGFSQSNTQDIEFLLALVPLFRVVDPNTPHLPYILYHNTFFHAWTAANRLPTAAGGPVRVKEFLYTTPPPYEYPTQSKTHGGDRIHPRSHSNHKPPHVSDHDEESPPQSYDGEGIDSETKW